MEEQPRNDIYERKMRDQKKLTELLLCGKKQLIRLIFLSEMIYQSLLSEKIAKFVFALWRRGRPLSKMKVSTHKKAKQEKGGDDK